MRLWAIRLVWLAVASLMPAAASAAAHPEAPGKPSRIPSAAFAERPFLQAPRISPNGDLLVARLTKNQVEYIAIHDLRTGKLQAIAPPEHGEVAWYRWAGNNRILVSFAVTATFGGSDIRVTRLLSYDLATRKFLFLGSRTQGPEGDDVLYVDPSGEWLLLSIQQTIYDWPSVYRIELATNRMSRVVRPQDQVWEWYADEHGVVRAGVGFLNRSWFMVYRKSEAESFRRIGKARYDDEQASLDMLRFTSGSDEGFILSNEKTGRYALYKYNFMTRELGDVVFESPTNDIEGFDLDADGKNVRAAWYTDDRDRVVWFDPKLKALQAEIDGALKDKQSWIVSRSRDDKFMLVWTGSARDPGSYYIFQPEAGVMKRLARINEKIDPNALSDTRYVRYKARDGLEIPGYLTLPAGRPAKGLPLIILPHGGPYGVRDKLEYSQEVQFLANRGYPVLQPNFRGSGSYGTAFYERGEGQWGRQMQDDLDDGMDWLAGEGTIDPKRVCLVGSSYGGYAALWGATRNPERYRCAASYAGVSDLRQQLNYQVDFLISRRYRKDWRTKVAGQKDFDLDSVSPLKQVDRLKVPVLVVHGDTDRRVPYKQSSLYAQALTKAGKPHEFHTYKGEGHGLSSKENWQDWLDRLEAFLAKHNPAD